MARSVRVTKVEREALTVGKMLFESLLLVVSVVLGFVISEWGTHAKERELAANVRRSVALEVAENMKTIDGQIARHRATAAAMGRTDIDPSKPAIQVLVENTNGGINALPMKRAAWDAAVSSGALRLLDHDLVELYSDIYVSEERLYDDDVSWLKTVIYRPENFDPKQQKTAVATLRGMMEELAGNETWIRDQVYRKNLPALQKAAR